MPIWPWRTKPTVQPWGDNYKVSTYTLPSGLTPIDSDWIVPDNIFAQPITAGLDITNVAGVRVNQFTTWTHLRGGRPIARSHYGYNTYTGNWFLTYAHGTTYGFIITQPLNAQGLFPRIFHLLPADTLRFSITGGLAGDSLNSLILTVQAWEIY